MSNTIRYDSLLVRDLAAELDRTLSGCRLEEASLERASLMLALQVRAARRSDAQPPSLLWNLHPSGGALHRMRERVRLGGRVQLGAPCFISSVTAPPDERLLYIDLETDDSAAGTARRIVIELVTNQWNALAVGADGRIVGVMRERRAGGRELRAGAPYEPPARSDRRGGEEPVSREEWADLVGGAPPGTRLHALVRSVAYTSPLNAAPILGDADVAPGAEALERAWERYVAMIWNATPAPCVIRVDGTPQPYSRAFGDATRAGSLLDAFELTSAEPADVAGLSDRALDALAQRMEATQRRIRRMQAQQRGAADEAAKVRGEADLLLAQLHRAERGAQSVELDDFAGGAVRVALDPSLSAADNAKRMYEAARKRSRAAERMPRLIGAAERELADLERLAERVRGGDVEDEMLQRLASTRASAKHADAAPSLPYREYRTSRGLEVRVGRGSRANDALTFRHSSPTDIWLHARDVAGAHVILRWSRGDENPSAHDIAEAAALAALYSRARTSGLVAVDWTRRKWVRKPRKAAPGLVIPERVKTVFVEPDPALEERLRADTSP